MLKRTRRAAALLAAGALVAAAVPVPAHASGPTDKVGCVVRAAADFADATINDRPYLPHNC